MQRVTGPDVVADLFGAGKDGFTEGDPDLVAGTPVSDDWLNAVQEEICNAIEAGAAHLDGSLFTQLMTSIKNQILFHALRSHVARTAAAPVDFTSVAWNGSVFVAVAALSGSIQTSPDGITWTARTAGSGFSANFMCVTWSQDLALFVAVGSSAEIQTSPDGITWTHRTKAGSYTGTFNGACWSATAAKFVIVGNTGEIQTSPDGTTWTHQTSGTTSTLLAVVYAGGQFVVVGFPGRIVTSPAGTTWTTRTADASYVTTLSQAHTVLDFRMIGDWLP